MFPDKENIIQKAVPVLWLVCGSFNYVFFPLGHKDVGIGWGEFFAHCCSFNLEEGVEAKLKVITFKADFQELQEVIIRDSGFFGCGWILFQGLFDCCNPIIMVDVGVHCVDICCYDKVIFTDFKVFDDFYEVVGVLYI